MSEDLVIELGGILKTDASNSGSNLPTPEKSTFQTMIDSKDVESSVGSGVESDVHAKLGLVGRAAMHLCKERKPPQTNKTFQTTMLAMRDCPEGYPRVAAFLDSDENFMLYRRFGFLQARLLLNKQDELRRLEKDLDMMDLGDSRTTPRLLKSRERDNHERGQIELLLEIEEKFKEYSQLLIAARDLATFNSPPAQDYTSVKSYFDEEVPLTETEGKYIYHMEDLVTLKTGRESAWLDAAISKLMRMVSSKFNRYIFRSKDLLNKTDPETTGITFYSRERVDLAVSFITTLVILALLMIPVCILYESTRVKDGNDSNTATGIIFAVLSCFTLLFVAVLALFTRAKKHEILASSAA